jgi:hypothetical protein
MRNWLYTLFLPMFLGASIAPAQQERHTDAQQDALLGPVKSVNTIETRSPVKWQQPAGPTLVLPLSCRDCAYDPDGTRTSSGQIVNGEFLGNFTELRRDGNGHVSDRVVTEATTGKVLRHEVIGPFGKTEETDFDLTTGKVLWRQTFAYDQYGHMRDWLSLDSDGKQASHTASTKLKDGTLTEESVWGKNGELSYQDTYDPDRDTEHFTVWDESGGMTLTWTFAHGKVVSFWERPDLSHDTQQFGEDFSDFGDRVDVNNYRCHDNGQCDHFRIHYEYFDPTSKRNPTTAEWRDADGNLLFAAYCEYELDSFGNWTHRKVSVYPSEQGERTLYLDDSRTITYWQQ